VGSLLLLLVVGEPSFEQRREAEAAGYLADSVSPGPEGPPPFTCVGQAPDVLVQPPWWRAKSLHAKVVVERRDGRACFA